MMAWQELRETVDHWDQSFSCKLLESRGVGLLFRIFPFKSGSHICSDSV